MELAEEDEGLLPTDEGSVELGVQADRRINADKANAPINFFFMV